MSRGITMRRNLTKPPPPIPFNSRCWNLLLYLIDTFPSSSPYCKLPFVVRQKCDRLRELLQFIGRLDMLLVSTPLINAAANASRALLTPLENVFARQDLPLPASRKLYPPLKRVLCTNSTITRHRKQRFIRLNKKEQKRAPGGMKRDDGTLDKMGHRGLLHLEHRRAATLEKGAPSFPRSKATSNKRTTNNTHPSGNLERTVNGLSRRERRNARMFHVTWNVDFCFQFGR